MVSIVACVVLNSSVQQQNDAGALFAALLMSHPTVRVLPNLGQTFVAVQSLRMSKPQVSFESDTLLSIIVLELESSHLRCAGKVSELQT